MINLKLSKTDKKNQEKVYSIDEGHNYPYGTRLRFEDATIKKSPFLQNAKAGTTVSINAVGKIIEVRTTDRENSKVYECVEIQLQKMDIGSLDEARDAFNED